MAKDIVKLETDERAMLRKKNTIILSGEINEVSAECFIQDMLILAGQEEVKVVILSPGGELTDGLAITAAIREAQKEGTKVVGQVYGHASSMASFIFEYCDIRRMDKDAILMIHGVREFQEGDIKNTEIEIALLHDMMHSQAEQLAARCREAGADKDLQEVDYWEQMLNEDTPHYFLADQALAAGLIDEVV